MALDFIARALAVAARTDAAKALDRSAGLDLFSSLPGRSIDPSITTLTTSGYAVSGSGSAIYVADAAATAALAAAHPRFCRASANGRYFRLAGEHVAVEQGGAAATPGINDQPAIQAAIAYANAVGIRQVRFANAAYELWCPLRTTASTDFNAGQDGIPMVVRGSVALLGVKGGTTLTLRNSVGGSRTTGAQTVAGQTWLGGAMLLHPNGGTMDFFHMEDLIIDGGIPYDLATGNSLFVNRDNGLALYLGCSRLSVRNCEMKGFRGEIFYAGGTIGYLYTENLKLRDSAQSAFNPGGALKQLNINLEAGNAYAPIELLSRHGATFIGGRFFHGYVIGLMAGPDPDFLSGYPYNYPVRQTAAAPPWTTFAGTRFEEITDGPYFSSFTRGSVVLVDSCGRVGGVAPNISDVHLDVEAWADLRGNFEAIKFYGPLTLTQPIAGTAEFVKPTTNVRVNVTCRRTALAAAAGRAIGAGVVLETGLYDKNSCHFVISGEAASAWYVNGPPVAGFAVPLIELAEFRTLAQPYGGTYNNPTADFSLNPLHSAYAFSPPNSGTYACTIGATYGYADGQKLVFYHNGSGFDRIVAFAANSATTSLPAPRKLWVKGDRLVLRYDSRRGLWVEDEYLPAYQTTYAASTAYDPPSIAAGATATTTITVSGASLGDYVERISLGVAVGLLQVSGHVSAANTVTVVLYNPTASAIDLAATTLAVEVRRR